MWRASTRANIAQSRWDDMGCTPPSCGTWLAWFQRSYPDYPSNYGWRYKIDWVD